MKIVNSKKISALFLLILPFANCRVTDINKTEFKPKSDESGSASVSATVISPSPSYNYPESFRQNFYYPKDTQNQKESQLVWNRDSYSNAAAEYGYPHHHSHHQNQYPTSPSSSSEDDFDDILGLGGLLSNFGGLGGLLGFKGLKGLGVLGMFKIALPLIIFGLPFLLFIPLLLFFLPVPVITIPSTTRRFGFDFTGFRSKMSEMARSVLESEHCVERISCEVGRVSKGSLLQRTIKKLVYKYEPYFPKPFQRMARAFVEENSVCIQHNCRWMDGQNHKKKSN